MFNKIIIAIDGTSSTGKSTLAKRLSDKLNYIYIDSGAMYRALTYYAIDKKYITESVFDSQKLIKDINNINIDFQLNKDNDKYEIHLNDIPVEKHIRTLTVSNYVSRIATIGELRKHMVKVQHSLGSGKGIISNCDTPFPNGSYQLQTKVLFLNVIRPSPLEDIRFRQRYLFLCTGDSG